MRSIGGGGEGWRTDCPARSLPLEGPGCTSRAACRRSSRSGRSIGWIWMVLPLGSKPPGARRRVGKRHSIGLGSRRTRKRRADDIDGRNTIRGIQGHVHFSCHQNSCIPAQIDDRLGLWNYIVYAYSSPNGKGKRK